MWCGHGKCDLTFSDFNLVVGACEGQRDQV